MILSFQYIRNYSNTKVINRELKSKINIIYKKIDQLPKLNNQQNDHNTNNDSSHNNYRNNNIVIYCEDKSNNYI